MGVSLTFFKDDINFSEIKPFVIFAVKRIIVKHFLNH